jgi:outer membrane lipoprotein-sorting protein
MRLRGEERAVDACGIERGHDTNMIRKIFLMRAIALAGACVAAGVAPAVPRRDAKDISQFVAPFTDLETTVRVVKMEPKELEKIGRDFALNYRLKNMTLLYKSPDKLRIEGRSNILGDALLIQNGASRFYAVPRLKLRKTEDLKESPSKRLSLLEYAGLVAKDTLGYMQAKWVKEEMQAGKPISVYELSYTGENGGKSKHRLWIDPETHLTQKRVWLDADNKVKATFLYSDPQETSPGVFLPGKCEILNAEGQSAAIMNYSGAKVDQGLADTLFAFAPSAP